MPSLKLNNVGSKSKHCGSFLKVAAEALEERQGRDLDIDRDRLSENRYVGFRTAAELKAYSQQHIAELSARQVAAGGRKIRNDAVVMCATIIKPPASMMKNLSEKDQLRFCSDAKRKLAEIVSKENIKSAVVHRDEQGCHMHVFWEPMTKDGRLCAKEVHNLQFLSRLNREMPEHLRSCGWDIDNCKAYDQAQEALKTAQERSEERSKHGRSNAAYKADAECEKLQLLDDIDKLKIDAKNQKIVIQKQQAEIEELKDAKGPIGRTGPLKKENEDLRRAIEERDNTIRSLEIDKINQTTDINYLKNEIERQKASKASIDTLINNTQADRELHHHNRFIEYLKGNHHTLYKAINVAYQAFLNAEKSLFRDQNKEL